MRIEEWPTEAREAMRNSILIKKEMNRIFPDDISFQDSPEKNERIDLYHFLGVKMSFSMGVAINILKETQENMRLSEAYRSELRKDLEWAEDKYFAHSQSVKEIYEMMQQNKSTNAPDDFQPHKIED
jgi:hypothetical protein